VRATLRRLVRVSVVLALVPAALALVVSTASASTADGVTANSMSFVGPVGIAAVVVGFGGLITGLVRHRRRGTAAPAMDTRRVTPVAEPVRSER